MGIFLFILNAVFRQCFFIMKKIKKLFKIYIRKSLRRLKKFRLYFRRDRYSVISMALIVLICGLAIGVANVRAGSLTPSGAPVASGYTLGDIYVRLATNATATAGNHDLATTTSPIGTFYTLTQIYNAIPTINAALVKLGTPYLGVTGTLIPNGGTATTSDVLLGKTYFGADQADWNLATGAYNASNLAAGTVKSGTAFGVGLTGDYPSAAFPLTGDTGATDATAAEICNTNEAWLKTGVMIAGNLNPIAGTIMTGTTICGVPGTALPNPAFGDSSAAKVLTTAGTGPGTYNATNLTPENVRKNITFGVGQTGTFEVGYGYGSDNATGVLTTAVGTPGTFSVANLANNLIKKDTTWGVSLGSTGTLTPNGLGTAVVADLFNGKTANLTSDWVLDTGALNLACNTTAFDGSGNLVVNAYDGSGDGTNRWCMATSTNSAVAGDIALYKSAWVNGVEINGSFASSTKTATLQGVDVTPDAGSWLYKVTVAITNLVAGVIKLGETVGGVAGSLLPSGGNATAADVVSGKTFFGATQTNWTLQTGTFTPWTVDSWANQKNQIIDDWLDGAGTTGTYNEYTGEEASWSIVSGSPFNAGFATSSNPLVYYPVGSNVYLASGEVKQDTRTGLWWSNVASTGAVTAVATSTTNDFWITPADPSRLAGKGDGVRPTAPTVTDGWDTTATTTVKNGNAINFCNALNAISFSGHADWYLPTQKELMQAYIDGAANNLPNPGNYVWSSTENYNSQSNAWYVSLSYGTTYGSTKVTSYAVRCVRRD